MCPHCGGQGIVRSVESTALRVLRGIEEEAQKQRAEGLTVKVAADVAMYTLNQKRRELSRLEGEYAITVNFEPKPELMAGAFEIDRVGHRNPEDFVRPVTALPAASAVEEEDDLDVVEEEELDEEDAAIEAAEVATPESEEPRVEREASENGGRRRRRRGGRNRGGRGREQRDGASPREAQKPSEHAATDDSERVAAPEDMIEGQEAVQPNAASEPQGDGEHRRRRRRRGRRGGNRERFGSEARPDHQAEPGALPAPELPAQTPANFGTGRFGDPDEIDTTPRTDSPVHVPNAASQPSWSLSDSTEIDTTPNDKPKPSDAPAKKGWWQRAFKS
jgi:ribonuclease E